MNQDLTLFDSLPTELVFQILDYLSCNDAIYSFFHLNERFNHILIQHRYCLQTFQMSKTNLVYYQNILPIIYSYIKKLIIKNMQESFELNLFSDLKSIILATSYYLFDKHLKLIIEYESFNQLKVLKIQNEFCVEKSITIYEKTNVINLIQRILNNNNNLQVFEYLFLLEDLQHYKLNLNLKIHSLTLYLASITDLLILMQYTPNLKYLNIKATSIYRDDIHAKPIIKEIKLKSFVLTFSPLSSNNQRSFNQLKDFLKQFSQTLICLSLNIAEISIDSHNFLSNGVELEKDLLKSMLCLKEFYLYLKFVKDSNMKNILSSFHYDYYIKHQWFFRKYNNYLYSISFQFEKIYDFNSTQLYLNENYLNNVTTIEINQGSIDAKQHWLISTLPNLKYLILNNVSFPSYCIPLNKTLNEKIQRLDVIGYLDSRILSRSILSGFSNLKYLQISFEMFLDPYEPLNCLSYVTNLLKTLKNLKNLSFTFVYSGSHFKRYADNRQLQLLIEENNMNAIASLYIIKILENWVHFIRS